MVQWTKDIISPAAAGTLDGMFRERARRTPDGVAYRSFEKAADAWIDMTWAQMATQVRRWRDAFKRDHLHPGDRVAVLLRNCPQWVVFDQAALAAGLVVIPLYTDDRPENIAYILQDCAARLVLIQDLARWRRLRPVLNDVSLRVLIAADAEPNTASNDAQVCYVDDWLASQASKESSDDYDDDPQRLASIVYTSGTTGRPKGVMLSHYNMLSNAQGILTAFEVYREDVFLSVLPLSHTLERTADYYMPIMAGATVAYNRSIPQLSEDMLALRPTVLICVPRLLERIHARIAEQRDKRSRLERWVFDTTIELGWRRFEASQGRARSGLFDGLWPLLEQRVTRPLLARFGGRLRMAVSGGAPLSTSVARLFIGLGLPVLQGYGLTETSPVVSVNRPENNDPTSVGPPLPDVELSIGADDELLVKGPGVMQGYWNNLSATQQMIDADGWLHTGDQVRIANGHIYITGRIKDILVLSNGEKVPPADMELAITRDPLFEQAMVIGEGQAFLAALLVVQTERWLELTASLGIDPDASASLENAQAHNAVLARLNQQLHDFPGYAKIRRVILTREPWSQENDLLTPTLKLKRTQVLGYYAQPIQRLFEAGLAAPRAAKS